MDPKTYAAFVLATVLLALVPGPNMALIVANSIRRGTRFGLLTLVGTTSAMVVQLALVALGMSALLAGAGAWFTVLRLAGAAYLVVIGIQSWRAPPPAMDASVASVSAGSTILRGLLVSLTNPKLLLFFGAFFPQFIAPERDVPSQVAVLSVTFVVAAAAIDSVWALLAGRARFWIVRQGRLLNRLSGGLLIGAGVGLALSRAT